MRTFPHLVDLSEFYPLQNQAIPKTEFVIGCIAQNRPRKQLQQVLLATKQLRAEGVQCILRLHTDNVNATRFGGDNLKRIIRALGLESVVTATEYKGCWDISSTSVFTTKKVADIIRSCDCMVIAPTCGGFEYGIIEAQACGVPVLLTKDGGILEEISGGAVHLLEPVLFDYTSYGSQSFRIAPQEITRGIKELYNNDEVRATLIKRGQANAAQYAMADHQQEFAVMLTDLFK